MKRFSLRTLLLLIALAAVSLGWWIERSREPIVYFLHVYSNLYHPSRDSRHPDFDLKTPDGTNTCLLTISITSGTPFYAEIPNNYAPTILLEGTLTRNGADFNGAVTVDIEDVGAPFTCDDITKIPIDRLVPFWDNSHHIAVSRFEDPYELHYDVGELP